MSKPTGLFYPEQMDFSEKAGRVSTAWMGFFKSIFDRVKQTSIEISFDLKNNQSTAMDIEGLQFDFKKVTVVYIDYVIQRISRGVGGTELVEAGTLRLVYKPKAGTWGITKLAGSGPDTGGVTFTVTNAGQVKYTSTNMAGTVNSTTPQKLTYRTRTISALLIKPGDGWA